MRYFTIPSQEHFEEGYIPREFGKTFTPSVNPALSQDSVLRSEGTVLVRLNGELLAINPDAGRMGVPFES